MVTTRAKNLTASKGRTLTNRSGSWLTAADRQGRRPRLVTEGLKAASSRPDQTRPVANEVRVARGPRWPSPPKWNGPVHPATGAAVRLALSAEHQPARMPRWRGRETSNLRTPHGSICSEDSASPQKVGERGHDHMAAAQPPIREIPRLWPATPFRDRAGSPAARRTRSPRHHIAAPPVAPAPTPANFASNVHTTKTFARHSSSRRRTRRPRLIQAAPIAGLACRRNIVWRRSPTPDDSS